MDVTEIVNVYERAVIGLDHVVGVEFDYAVRANNRPIGPALVDHLAVQTRSAHRAALPYGGVALLRSACQGF
jgi:hypothetical protein